MAPPHFCLSIKILLDRLGILRIRKPNVKQKIKLDMLYIKVDTIKQEIEQDVDRMDDTSGDINPYCKIIVNKAERQ